LMDFNLMNSANDAFGQVVWAYYNGENAREIVERDDGYIYISSGAASYFAEFDKWPDHQKLACEYVKGKVLDAGCGAGRVGLYLQGKGFDVTGIDISPLAVKVCQLRGMKDVRLLPIEEVQKFVPGTFDTILMYCYNFGLFCGFDKAKTILRKLHKVSAPGAVMLAESEDPYIMNNPYFLNYRELNEKRGRMPGQVRIRVRFRKYAGEWFDYLYVSREEMEKILEGTGWRVRQFIGSSGSAFMAVIDKI
jgi:SAM-dependent methyltransferase